MQQGVERECYYSTKRGAHALEKNESMLCKGMFFTL